MNHSLRKLAASVGLAYADGTATQTLIGTDFVLDNAEGARRFCIDLSNNSLSRNRGLPCFDEAEQFVSRPDDLRSVTISEKNLVEELGAALKQDMPVRLELAFGNGNKFAYDAVADLSGTDANFIIRGLQRTAA
jgi:hypothetical protein